MVDLLVVITCVGLIVIALAIGSALASRKSLQLADQAIGNLKADKARLEQQVGDWTVSANTAEQKYRALLASLPKDDQSPAIAIAQAAKALKSAEASKESGDIRQELLGIPGELRNTVFVIDRSSSMLREGRWEDTKKTIQTWVKYLPVQRAALVLFGDGIRVIPTALGAEGPLKPDGRELPMVTNELREVMQQELENMGPSGGTPTYAALRRAMDFKDLDAIILFTDGDPDATAAGVNPFEEVVQLVRDWHASHPAGRVHVVGIGDYFKSTSRNFLRGVAAAGSGAFIGR
jgi:Mg-chelatase subunit ChlD